MSILMCGIENVKKEKKKKKEKKERHIIIINLFFITQNKNTQTQTETETNLRSLDPISLSLSFLTTSISDSYFLIYIYIGIECTYKPNSLSLSSSFYLDWKLSLSDTQKCEFEDKDNSNTQKKKKKYSFKTQQNPYLLFLNIHITDTTFNTIMTVLNLFNVGFVWSEMGGWALSQCVLCLSVPRCCVFWLVVLWDLERTWPCSASSFIGSHQKGFWRSLKGFMVCFSFGSVYLVDQKWKGMGWILMGFS